jgi:Tfp pilus assembly protein PilV
MNGVGCIDWFLVCRTVGGDAATDLALTTSSSAVTEISRAFKDPVQGTPSATTWSSTWSSTESSTETSTAQTWPSDSVYVRSVTLK